MAEDKLYFAYGSNINLDQMAYRCPAAQMVLPPSSPKKGSRSMACFGGSRRTVNGLSISMRDIPTYTKKSLLLCGIMRGGS